ncbi:MAG: bacterioferritin [Bacteroidota bacterium]
MADKSKLIEGLKDDLANELGAVMLYLYQTSIAAGFDGEELRELLRPEVAGELAHATFLADKIAALGGDPTTRPKEYRTPTDVKGMLELDLKLEQQAVETYKKRAQQAEEYGDLGLKVKIEEIIAEETGHVEQIERILRGWK